MAAAQIVIVTPALADANNGNWQTAQRWAHFLRPHHAVRLADAWAHGDEALMIALHARRSAPSIAAWREHHPNRPLVLVLTGTDLYRDIAIDASAQHSLQLADRLVVLNQNGVATLPLALRAKAVVCLQSCTARQPLCKTRHRLRALMVGHLRPEKSPETFFEAARLLAPRGDILLDHIGGALDPALGRQARALQRSEAHYRWLGALPHGATRQRIQRAHVLVHASRMEGGAHVVIEALRSGTPVLASRIDGNVGLLGARYGGYFECGDAAALARLLERARDEPAMLAALRASGDARAALFDPAHERAALMTLLQPLLARATPEGPDR